MSSAPVFDVLLYQPEIPPNTGNAIRLCANTGARLHLVRPLGFDMEDRQLRRAGLDYHEYARVAVHDGLDAALAAIAPARLFALSARGAVRYDAPRYRAGDAFLFGCETSGLSDAALARVPGEHRLVLPMRRIIPAASGLDLASLLAAALLIVFENERNAVAFIELADACALKSGGVDEHVLAAVVGLNEAITLCAVEEFYDAGDAIHRG